MELRPLVINALHFSFKKAGTTLKLTKKYALHLKRKLMNNLQILGIILCFIGTVFIIIDRFDPVNRFIDNHTKWHHVNLAIEKIKKIDYKTSDGKFIGYVGWYDHGFVELVDIIKNNHSDLKKKEIVGIAMNQIAVFGGIPYRIIHAKLKNEAKGIPLTSEYIFYEWIRNSREKYSLKIGIFFIAVGFLCSMIEQIITKKKRVNVMNKHNFYEVKIPYDKCDKKKYRELLKRQVFPVIDELCKNREIDSYYFLTHKDLDLRLALVNENNIQDIKDVLKKYDLPIELKKCDLENKWIEEENEILKLNTEITRFLLKHPDMDKFYPSVIHYQNNSFGMKNSEEVDFYINSAISWLTTIKVEHEGKKIEIAEKEAIEQIINSLQKNKTG